MRAQAAGLAIALTAVPVAVAAAVPQTQVCDQAGFCQYTPTIGFPNTTISAGGFIVLASTSTTVRAIAVTEGGTSTIYCGVYNSGTTTGVVLGTNAVKYSAITSGQTWNVNFPPTTGVYFPNGVVIGCETGFKNGTAVASSVGADGTP